MASIRTIIVACDGSPHAAAAADHAALLARAVNAPVHLVHAFPSSPSTLLGMPGPSAEMVGVQRLDEKTFRRLWDEAAKEAFASARQALGKTDFTVEEVKRAGDPSRVLIDYANECADPIIVIGRRGLGRFSEALLGSVSQRVLHWADCPVVVVN